VNHLLRPAVLGLVLLAAGCSDDPAGGTAKPGGSPTAPASNGPEAKNGLAAFTACMRVNGVPNFPAPDRNGAIRIGENDGIDPSSPEYGAAYEACQDLV
jgi:hypothetical protein